MIDSLIAAGAERMAVNIANGLASAGVESHLCATHSGGPLEEFISPDVKLFILGKKSSHDLKALFKLRKYICENKIDIIHAHSSSLFWAVFIKWQKPGVKVVWHDHFGFSEQLHLRSASGLRFFNRFVSHAFVVNDILMNYAVSSLKMKKAKVSFLANFADIGIDGLGCVKPDIPDIDFEPKIVCLANLRPQKDHNNLLDAFSVVVKKYPRARLYLVGGHFNDDYYRGIVDRVANEQDLLGHVHILGSRNDVAAILSVCQMGVLSSISEGLPVSLLEYGLSGLPVVCTNVGDCSFVLDNGKCGRLVEPNNSDALAGEMLFMLEQKDRAREMASLLKERVLKEFSQTEAINKIINEYRIILKK